MKTIQKLTLSLLSLAAISSWNTATAADTLIIRVDRDATDVPEIDASLVGSYRKVNAGPVLISGANLPNMTGLEIQGGKVQINETNNVSGLVDFNKQFGGDTDMLEEDKVSLEVLTNGAISSAHHQISTPALKLSSDADVIADANTEVILVGLHPAGAGTLNLYSGEGDDRGVTIPSVFSNRSNDMNIYGETHFGDASVTGSYGNGSTLTTGNAKVKDGGLLVVVQATAGAAPGITEVETGGMLEVAAGVHVPTNDASDVFSASGSGSLQFDNNSTLWLGNGSIWSRPITVGVAVPGAED